MTIAILPMLIEALPMVTGAVAGVAACAFIYLRQKHTSSESSNQDINKTQADASTTPLPEPDTPEPAISSVAETIANEVSEVIQEEIKVAVAPVVEARSQLSAQEQATRQQQLQEIAQMLIATTFPRPTDSALSRHYDAMIAAKAEDCLEDATKMARLQADYEACQRAVCAQEVVEIVAESGAEVFEEESMLRRHHMHNIRVMLEATTFPRPTDSMLRRHYDEMIDAKADDCLENEAKMARLIADYEEYETAQAKAESAVPKASVPASKRCIVPEDSMLRRHFLTNLRANIETLKGARPTDSALRRHYDSMINAEMEKYLECQ